MIENEQPAVVDATGDSSVVEAFLDLVVLKVDAMNAVRSSTDARQRCRRS